MRQNELKEGVVVEDRHGNVIGSSNVAAKKVSFSMFNVLCIKIFTKLHIIDREKT